MSTKPTITEELAFELVVIENFAAHLKGEIITEAAKIKELLESEWAAHVIRKSKPQASVEPSAS